MALSIGKMTGHKITVLNDGKPVARLTRHTNGGAITVQMLGDRKQHHLKRERDAMALIERKLGL